MKKNEVTPTTAPRVNDVNAMGFFSALARGIDAMKTVAAPVEGWKDAIKGLVNKGAAKADEVEWSGIHEWLDLQQGKVPKELVQEYLRGNGVQVQEMELGLALQQRQRESLAENFRNLLMSNAGFTTGDARIEVRRQRDDRFGPVKRWADPDILAAAQALKEADSSADLNTKYEKYTLPGGENYREVLLTLPGGKEIGSYAEWLAKRLGITEDEAEDTPEYEDDALHAQFMSEEARSQQSYHSSHWDQPNVLAHIRLTDRVDADGDRVLFVEELQSDWGQDGKKKGFQTPFDMKSPVYTGAEMTVREFLKREGAAAQEWVDGQNAQRADLGESPLKDDTPLQAIFEDGKLERATTRIRGPVDQWVGMLQRSWDGIRTQAAARHANENINKTPAAPFVTNTDKWLNLALKRIVTMAAQEGYDKVAFVNGEQSAGRYDLSKHVDSVRVYDNEDGTFALNVRKPDSMVWDAVENAIKPEQIEGYVGKDLAERIIKDFKTPGPDRRDYKGLDLKVGGEGMKAFYNQIVPAAVKKLVGKLGGKIASVQIGKDRMQVKEKMGGWVIYDTVSNTFYLGPNSPRAWGLNPKVYLSKTSAQGALENLPVNDTDVALHQPGFTITQAMREKVAGGLPMFSRAGGITAATVQAVTQWQEAVQRASSNPQARDPNMQTPAVLRYMGAKADRLVLSRTYLRAITGKHPDVPSHVFENLPAMLADPLFIIPYKGGGVRVFVEAQTAKREPIFVGVDIGRDGRINTVSPLHDWKGKTGLELLSQGLHNAMSRPGKIYARNKEALEQARASAAAAPAILAMHRGSVSKPTVITRTDVVKLIQAGKDPKYSFAGRNAATADLDTLEQAQERLERFAAVRGQIHNLDKVAISGVNDGGAYGFRVTQDGKYLDRFASLDAAQAFVADEKARMRDLVQQARNDSPEAVRKETGWHKGADGEWRFEISDKGATLAMDKLSWGESEDLKQGSSTGVPLARLLDHPLLFDAYPGLNKIWVHIAPGKQGASFDPGDNKIVIGYDRASNSVDLSLLLHELQHTLQAYEGFARGGNPEQFKPISSDDVAQLLKQELKAAQNARAYQSWFLDAPETPTAAQQKAIDRVKAARHAIRAFDQDGMDPRVQTAVDQYRRLAGEVEARNTQARMGMDDTQRKATPPSQTQDTADADQIVRGVSRRSEISPKLNPAQLRQAIGKHAKTLADLEKNGLVTIAQTQDQALTAAALARAEKTGQSAATIKRLMLAAIDRPITNHEDCVSDLEGHFSDASSQGALDIKRSASGQIQGFFDPVTFKSFLVADALSAETVHGVLMHEVGIHMAADGSMDALFEQAGTLLQSDDPFMARVRERMKQAGETSNEEAAAYITEEYVNAQASAPKSVKDWIDNFFSTVRAWLYRHGVVITADQLTPADIAAVAKANVKEIAAKAHDVKKPVTYVAVASKLASQQNTMDQPDALSSWNASVGKGQAIGRIVALSDDAVIQDAGRKRYVSWDRKALQAQDLEVGEMVTITDKGAVTRNSLEEDHGLER